jgi:hypothetical protein
MPGPQRRSQPGPSPLYQVHLTGEPSQIVPSLGLVQDPTFWVRFSTRMHLSEGEKLESGLRSAPNLSAAKEGYVADMLAI